MPAYVSFSLYLVDLLKEAQGVLETEDGEILLFGREGHAVRVRVDDEGDFEIRYEKLGEA